VANCGRDNEDGTKSTVMFIMPGTFNERSDKNGDKIRIKRRPTFQLKHKKYVTVNFRFPERRCICLMIMAVAT
jgi:hypothetical protein